MPGAKRAGAAAERRRGGERLLARVVRGDCDRERERAREGFVGVAALIVGGGASAAADVVDVEGLR